MKWKFLIRISIKYSNNIINNFNKVIQNGLKTNHKDCKSIHKT